MSSYLSNGIISAVFSKADFGVQLGLVVKCLTHNPAVPCSSCTGSSGVFRLSVLGQDTSEPQPSTGETQERHE